MRQKEEMYNERNAGGGTGFSQSPVSDNNNSWVKYVAFGVIFIAIATGIVLAII